MKNDRASLTRRITKNALFLALLCLIGMFSIPFGENIKVSLQLLIVFIICLLADSWIDVVFITGCYLLLGLFLPIYAGFSAGITPTFGFVIGFVLCSPVVVLMKRIPKIHPVLRMGLACFVGLLIVYASGTVFLCAYLQWDFVKGALVTVVPYLPFDAVKIVLAVWISAMLVKVYPAIQGRRKDEHKDGE